MPADDLDDLPDTVTSLDPAPKKKAKPQPVVEEDDETPVVPAAPKHPARLVQHAKQFGFTDADLAEYSTDALHREVEQIRQWNIEQSRQKQAAPVEKKVEPEEEDFDLGPEADELQLDDKTKKMLKRIALAPMKEAKAMKAKIEEKLAALEQQHTQRRNSDLYTMLDDAFDTLPAKFKKIFGEGSGTDPEFMKTSEFKRRASVLREANLDPDKMTLKSSKRAILAAAESLFGFAKAPEEEEEEESAPKVKKKTPPKDPESGRFTVEDYANGKIAKGSDRVTGLAQLDVVEGVRRILGRNGTDRSSAGEEDDLPG